MSVFWGELSLHSGVPASSAKTPQLFKFRLSKTQTSKTAAIVCEGLFRQSPCLVLCPSCQSGGRERPTEPPRHASGAAGEGHVPPDKCGATARLAPKTGCCQIPRAVLHIFLADTNPLCFSLRCLCCPPPHRCCPSVHGLGYFYTNIIPEGGIT